MRICGACDRELPDDSYSEEERTEAEYQEMPGVRGRGKSAGADEERPQEVGGGRVSHLQPTVAA